MLEIVKSEGADLEKEVLDLLLLADPSEQRIRQYTLNGSLFLAYLEGQLAAAIVILVNELTLVAELINIAVQEQFQNRGLGQDLIVFTLEYCQEQGLEAIELGTANSSIAQLYFYQKCGFEMSHILPNYFLEEYGEAIFENGLQAKHMVRFRKDL